MIIINNEDALRVNCDDVLDHEVNDIIAALDLELELSARNGNPGIGLAAPQIGIAKKAAIIRVGEYKINLINAVIDKKYDLKTFQNEGCLSFPNRIEITNRYQEVTVVNNLVGPKSMILTGLLAVVVQHEIQHYFSELFLDHIIKQKKLRPNDICNCNSGKKYKKCCGK